MGIVLKSNVAVQQKKLTDLGLSGLTGYLDFRDSTYKIGSNSVALTNIISCTRNGIAGAYNGVLEYSSIAANTPRISTDPTTMKKGLVIEGLFTNSLLNSFTPINRSLSFSLGSKIALIFECIGSGSAELFSGGVSLGVARQNSPVVYINNSGATQNLDLSIVISGTLEYYCMYSGSGSRKRITRIATTTVSSAYNSDVIKVNEALINTLLNKGEGCVVIKQSHPTALFNRNLTTSAIMPFFQFLEASTDNGVYVSRMENGSRPNFLRVKDSIVDKYWNISDLSENNTIAVNLSKTSAKAAINGVVGLAQTFNAAIDLTRMYLCSGVAYTTNGTQLVQEILFFNRQLTDEELLRITAQI